MPLPPCGWTLDGAELIAATALSNRELANYRL
jgi:hypothetical protein